jgi:hypothetical protein
VPAFAPFLALLLASVVPEAESPLPDRIGLGLPFATAGAGGVLAGIVYSGSSAARRDRAINKGGLVGFGVGAVAYLLALAIQIAF